MKQSILIITLLIIMIPLAYAGVYNSARGVCEEYPTSEQICSESYTYNPQTNTCQSFPLEQIVCPAATAYSSIEGKCVGEGIVADIQTPAQACIELGGNYVSSTNTCEFEATKKNFCIQQGMNYDADADTCVYVEQVTEIVEQTKPSAKSTTYNFIIYGLIGLIAWYVIFEAGGSKGFFKTKKR